jgi:hypothetical protein
MSVKNQLIYSRIADPSIAVWRGQWRLLSPETNRMIRVCECEVEEGDRGQMVSFHTEMVHLAVEFQMPLGVVLVVEERPA